MSVNLSSSNTEAQINQALLRGRLFSSRGAPPRGLSARHVQLSVHRLSGNTTISFFMFRIKTILPMIFVVARCVIIKSLFLKQG